nr:MAG TPA: hypothetical protein [Caudoviricetes sp.]
MDFWYRFSLILELLLLMFFVSQLLSQSLSQDF